MRKPYKRCDRAPELLSGSFWDNVGQAFTDPDKQFQFPIKPMEIELTQDAKNTIYIGVGLLVMGAITTALIVKSKTK